MMVNVSVLNLLVMCCAVVLTQSGVHLFEFVVWID